MGRPPFRTTGRYRSPAVQPEKPIGRFGNEDPRILLNEQEPADPEAQRRANVLMGRDPDEKDPGPPLL
jgi:hypothetical protein